MHNSITKLLDKLRWPSAGSRGVMVKCPDCGAENFADEWFCNRCGAELPALQYQPRTPLPLKQGKRGPVVDIENYPLSASPAGRRTEATVARRAAAARRAAVYQRILGGAAYVVRELIIILAGLVGAVILLAVVFEAIGRLGAWLIVPVFAGGAYYSARESRLERERRLAFDVRVSELLHRPLAPGELLDLRRYYENDSTPEAAVELLEVMREAIREAEAEPKESDLSPADLWDKKVFEGMDPDVATAYVYRVKGGG